MIIRNTIQLLLLLMISTASFGQYEVNNLGENINSEYEELNPVLSGNGERLFFVRANHPENNFGRRGSQDIWMAEKGPDGNWQPAQHLPDRVNISRYNAVLWVNDAGDEILISGEYDKKGKHWLQRGMSRIAYDNGKWSRPTPVEIKKFHNLNEGKLAAASLSQNETVLVLSFSKVIESSRSDLFISIKKGNKFSKPKKLKDISSKYDDQAPFINSDHNVLFFSSNRSTSGSDNYDIFKSEKLGSSWTEWSAPQPVDFGINTSGYESYFKLSKDGKSALFVSTDKSIGNSDIFEIILEEEKPEMQTITAAILESSTNKLLPYTNFDLIVDGRPVEYMMKRPDSVVFEFNIEQQEEYELTARINGYNLDTVNLRADDLGIQLYDAELMAKRITYDKAPEPIAMVLKGNMYEKSTGAVLPSTKIPSILINDISPDSMNYDIYSGSYELHHTSLDSVLVLRVNVEGFLPYSKALKVGESDTIDHDIYLNKKEAKVIVTGRIINNKTKAPISDLTDIDILVNGVPNTNVAYLPEENSYQLYLGKDSLYSIEAHKSGFFGMVEELDLQNSTFEKVNLDLYLSPVEVGQSVMLDNIFFKSGSSELLKESIPELNRVAEFLRENPTLVIEIAGYTDNVGSDTFNQKLSEERAKSVARYIILKGFGRERIEFKGYGEENPIASNDTAEGREQNRRVEFKVLRN